MWKLLPWANRGSAGYPQRECFFCCTTSIVLPPYNPEAASLNGSSSSGPRSHPDPSYLASSSATTISTGTPTNWFCSSCHCQNVATEDGAPAEQYTRPMWDEEWNRHRSQLMRHTQPRPPGPSKSDKMSVIASLNPHSGRERFTFCHTCQTNQVLTLNMLSDYVPSEDDPEYQQRLDRLPEYQASIAARYPAVCSNCAPRVQEKITERDQFARSWSLGKWLELRKKTSKGELAPPNVGSPPSSTSTPTQPSSSLESWPGSTPTFWSRIWKPITENINPESGSILSLVIFVLATACVWVLYSASYLRPGSVITLILNTSRRAKEEPTSSFTAVIGLLTLVCLPKVLSYCSRIDPLKRSVDSARLRQMRVEINGEHFWRTTQLAILLLRASALCLALSSTLELDTIVYLLHWLQSVTNREPVQLVRLAAITLLAAEIGLTLLAALQLQVKPPTPLHLVSHPIVATGKPVRASDWCSDPLLTSLSLDGQEHHASIESCHTDSVEKATSDPQADSPPLMPSVLSDADGDAVMEDAASYSARRMSESTEDDGESGLPHNPPPPPTSAWSSHWWKGAEPASFPPSFTGSQDGTTSDRIGTAVRRPTNYNDFQLGPQRFWEPQKPTGLEDVFGRAVSLDDRPQRKSSGSERNGDASVKWSKWFGFT